MSAPTETAPAAAPTTETAPMSELGRIAFAMLRDRFQKDAAELGEVVMQNDGKAPADGWQINAEATGYARAIAPSTA